jgi:hypothetical protein
VARAALGPGDVLIRANHYVRLVNALRGTRVSVFEALGGRGRGRAYAKGDLMGRVIHRDVAWDRRYVPHSPFPQLIAFQPPAFGAALEIQFAGSGELAVEAFCLDGTPAPYRALSTSPLHLVHTAPGTLPAGRHEIRVTVDNRVSGQEFRDSFARPFDVPRP